MPPIALDETLRRRQKLQDIINQFRSKGSLINRFTLQPELEKAGFKASFTTIYRDMTALNKDNTWVRDLAESNYSAYQESISSNLELVEQQANEKFKETGNHVWLNIVLRVQETKMKHTQGDNINISAALLHTKFNELKKQQKEEEPKIDVIKLAASRR